MDKVHRRLWVPLKASGRPVVRHELAHVLWSPLKLPKVRYPIACLHAVEDARINLGLVQRGVPVELDTLQRTHVHWLALSDLEEERLSDFTLRWVASLGTDAAALLEAAALEAGEPGAFAAKLCSAVYATLERSRGDAEVASFDAAMRAARSLARQLKQRGLLDARFSTPTLSLGCCDGGEADPDPDSDPSHPIFGPADGPGEGGSDGLGSGFMSVVEAPLTQEHPGARKLRPKWRAAAEGVRIGALHRWAVDKAVFRRRVRQYGGSILIDMSGSMSLQAEDVDALLDASRGAATVAVYSGRGDRGELRVVARNGRRAAPEHLSRFGGGNIVDAPALEWLSKQPEPRCWVSDNGVSGIEDRPNAKLRSHCDELRRKARIQRFESAQDVARSLDEGLAPRRIPRAVS